MNHRQKEYPDQPRGNSIRTLRNGSRARVRHSGHVVWSQARPSQGRFWLERRSPEDLRMACILGPRGPRPLAGTPTRSQTRRRASWLGPRGWPRGPPWRQRRPRTLPTPAVWYGAGGGGHLDARVGCCCWVVGLSPMDPMTKWAELQHQRRPGTTGGFRAPNQLGSRAPTRYMLFD
jgi:hypothetical protein